MAVKNFVELKPEDIFFQKKEAEKIKALRERASSESTAKYREEHNSHCFRCGTLSLVEVKKGDVVIDICVNDGCGAVHLDSGELEAIAKGDKETILNVRKAIFNIFN